MIRLLQLLILAALVWVAWRLVRNLLAPPPRDATGAPSPPAGFEPTGRCDRCGTHVPRGELDAAGQCRRCAAQPRE